MKDKGEIYLLVGKFREYSAKTFQFILASSDKSQLEALRDDLQKRAEAVQENYRKIISPFATPISFYDRERAFENLDLEARAIAFKFEFRDDAEFFIETVKFNTTREGADNGD